MKKKLSIGEEPHQFPHRTSNEYKIFCTIAEVLYEYFTKKDKLGIIVLKCITEFRT